MLIIPQFRMGRRASGATPITVNQTVTGTTGVTFTGVVAGELLVILATGTNAQTTPSGWTLVASSSTRAYLYTKTAVGGEGAVSVVNGAVSVGYRLSHGTVTTSANSSASATSLAAGASALDPASGSLMLAGVGLGGNISAPSASNSFTVQSSGARGIVADRYYSTGASAQNCTLSWTTARAAASLLVLVSP